jgi:hypothetical protein
MLKLMCRIRRVRPVLPPPSAFTGFRFPREVIAFAVRWYLRYGLSYRDLEELLAERGVRVDHVTVYRWVQRFTPLLIDAARPCRHCPGDRWYVDETYVKVAGRVGAGTRPPVLTWFLGGWFVLVNQATKNRSTLDPFRGDVGDWVIRPGRLEVERAVRTSSVVVPRVLGQDSTQVPAPSSPAPHRGIPQRDGQPLQYLE